MALDTRKRYFAQHARYTELIYVKANNSLNLKQVISSDVEKDTGRFLSFYMDSSYISSAMKAYPSTYNPVTGNMLEEYNKNRSKFLEDYQAGKYDKKKA